MTIRRTSLSFNEWICKNAGTLQRKLGLCRYFDRDAFQEAYLSMATGVEAESDPEGYEQSFLKAYCRFTKRSFREQFLTFHPCELFFMTLPTEDTDIMEKEEAESIKESTAVRIQRHIYATFPRKHVRIFQLRMSGFSCRDITDVFGVERPAINGITNRIINQTRRYFANIAH